MVEQAVSSPDGGGYNLYGATDANGTTNTHSDAALPSSAPAQQQPPAAATGDQAFGAGPDQLVLLVSEDWYGGDAQFIVTLDGVQLAGTLSTSASHAAGAVQRFSFGVTAAPGHHSVGVYFLNNLGGSPGADILCGTLIARTLSCALWGHISCWIAF